MDATSRFRTPLVIAMGTVGGLVLGIAARAWMRLISTEPEFTWNGTMFIVLGFTIWGAGQGVVTATRERTEQRWKVTTARVVGGVTTLPLFVAAGGIMFPTVIGGGLARHRTDWPTWVRAVLLLVATLPVVMVGVQLHGDWGFGTRWLAGMGALLAIYSLVVAAERATLQHQGNGWRVRSVLRVLAAAGAVLAIIVAGRGLG